MLGLHLHTFLRARWYKVELWHTVDQLTKGYWTGGRKTMRSASEVAGVAGITLRYGSVPNMLIIPYRINAAPRKLVGLCIFLLSSPCPRSHHSPASIAIASDQACSSRCSEGFAGDQPQAATYGLGVLRSVREGRT